MGFHGKGVCRGAGEGRLIIESPSRFESYGAVKIFDVIKVLSIDGLGYKCPSTCFSLDYDTLMEYGSKTAIVVPVKDEELLTLENVLAAIPHVSPVILVSASSRKPVDRYAHEVELAKSLFSSTRRPIIIVHQFDPAWSEALKDTPLEIMLDNRGVRPGKGEALVLGVIVAAALKMKYVGFIDSDNYVPGAAHEYAWIYYAGFAMSESKYTMVRIKWPFKGKLASSDIYLRKRGRVSILTNNLLNQVLTALRRVETEIIQTANSGEHAMTLDLALSMKWAGGFAVEPYELIYLLESCFANLDPGECRVLPDGVNILQVEARNPHIHAERGDEHIIDMVKASIAVLLKSGLVRDDTRRSLINAVREYFSSESELEAAKQIIYDLRGVDPHKLFTKYISHTQDAVILSETM